MLEDIGLYTLVQNSYSNSSVIKCIYFKYEKGLGNLIYVPKNGDATVNITYDIYVDGNGIIKAKVKDHDAPELGFDWYPVVFEHGIYLSYGCNGFQGLNTSPQAGIYVSNSKKDILNTQKVTDIRHLVEQWGLEFKYYFSPEYFTNQ